MKTIVGITGGIGSGKSTVARLVEMQGYPLYVADVEARRVALQPEVLAQVREAFGNEMMLPNDMGYDRKKMAALVFADPQALQKLNAIIHPAVRRDLLAWKDAQKSDVLFYESAILFESGSWKLTDLVTLVSAPENVRIRRVKGRDGMTEEQIIARIRNQMPEEEKQKRSSFVIDNSGPLALLPQVKAMIEFAKDFRKV